MVLTCETCHWWTRLGPGPGNGTCSGNASPDFNRGWLVQLLRYGSELACAEHMPRSDAPSEVHPDPSRARDEVTERSQDEAGGEQLKADTAKS